MGTLGRLLAVTAFPASISVDWSTSDIASCLSHCSLWIVGSSNSWESVLMMSRANGGQEVDDEAVYVYGNNQTKLAFIQPQTSSQAEGEG